MRRNDIHSPSNIIPEDYVFVAFGCIKIEGDPSAVFAAQQARLDLDNHMARTGGTWSSHAHGGVCHICGAHAIYTIIFWHEKTNTYIRTGNDCADKLSYSESYFNAFQHEIRAANKLAKGKKAAIAAWNEAGLTRGLGIAQEFRNLPGIFEPSVLATAEQREAYRLRERRWQYGEKIASMLATTELHGVLSPKRISAITFLTDKHNRWEQIQAEFEAAHEKADACPTGRVTVTGTVLKIETKDSEFGLVEKMTVKADGGFMVYVSVPRGVLVQRGDTITFIATVTPSTSDPKFGFGSRPKMPKGFTYPEPLTCEAFAR
jgi:hypothetical protein